MTTNTNNTNTSNHIHAQDTMDAIWYQPADPHNHPDAFSVRMKHLRDYTVIARPLPPPTTLQLTKWAAEHRHLQCDCGTRYPAQYIVLDGRPDRHVDVDREGKCPDCGRSRNWTMRFHPNGLVVSRETNVQLAWIRPVDPKPSGTYIEEAVFWMHVDWTRQDCELAEEHGVPHTKVWDWRRRLRQPRSPRHHRHRKDRTAAKYATADWTRPDSELARKFGVTRQRIHQVRQKFRQQNSRRPVAASLLPPAAHHSTPTP